MPTNIEQLSRRIEKVVHEHLAACRREAEAAVGRAFNAATRMPSRVVRSPRPASKSRRSGTELDALRVQLYEMVLSKPGETMTVLARAMNSSGVELQFPMRQLRESKHVRSAGERNATRYFPMMVAKSA